MSTLLVFPGQGSQTVGMAATFASHPATAHLFTEANAALGINLTHLMLQGPIEELTATQNAQPALLLAGIAAFTFLKQQCPTLQPAAMAGHSLGEYTALCAAGAISLTTALQLVRARGQAMAQAGSGAGGMAAVLGLTVDACTTIAAQTGTFVANINSPSQIILAGPLANLQQAEETAQAAGAERVLRLPVSGAFHTPAMQPAAQVVADFLIKNPLQNATTPVYGCATARPATAAAQLADNIVQQITSPVAWHSLMQHAVEGGVTTVLELGAGNVLTNLAKRMATPGGVALHTHSLDTVEAIHAYVASL